MAEPRQVISGYKNLTHYTGIGRTQTQELIDKDQFPPPEKLSARHVCWFADTIALWQRWRTTEPTSREGGWQDFVERGRAANRNNT